MTALALSRRAEGLLFALVFGAVAFHRVHALARVPSFWDGETAYHLAVATDFEHATRTGLHLETPTISQGWLWYAFHFTTARLLGTSIVSLRLAWAAVSFGAALLLYVLVRRIAGPLAGLLAASFFAFSPIALGWARQEYAFPLVELHAVGLVLVAHRAARPGARLALVGLVALMGLASVVYPAGRPLVLVPVVWWGVEAWRRRALERRRAVALLAGLLAFAFLPSALASGVTGELRFVHPLPHGASENVWLATSAETDTFRRAGAVAAHVAAMARTLSRRVVVECGDVEYTPLAALQPKAYLSPVVALLAAVGLFRTLLSRAETRAGPIVLWALFALPVALVSLDPEARRFAAFFPAVAALAAVSAAELLDAVARSRPRVARGLGTALVLAVTFGEGSLRARLFFAQPAAEPIDVAVARGLRGLFASNAVLVVALEPEDGANVHNRVFYELLDDLRAEDAPLWAPVPASANWAAVLGDPLGLAKESSAPRTWLRDSPVLRAPRSRWRRAVFVLPDTPAGAGRLAELRTARPDARLSLRDVCAGPEICRWRVATVELLGRSSEAMSRRTPREAPQSSPRRRSRSA